MEATGAATPHRTRHDVVVVGARCAGAATAMLLARQGHDVALVDRARLPSDTLSTHGFSRGGVVQLRRWGLLEAVLESGAPPVREVSFHLGEEIVRKKVKHRAGVDLLVAPRRHVLDQILVAAAVRAGAHLLTGVNVRGVRRDAAGRVVGVEAHDAYGTQLELDGHTVVGADGVRSRIARSVGAPVVHARPSPSATQYAYYSGLDGDGFEFHFGDRLFPGVFRTHAGEACVFVCSPAVAAGARGGSGREAAFDDLVARGAPGLAWRLRRARRTSPVRGTSGLPNHVRRAWGAGWALVGDAGYHRDPITGHGITDAFRDAELLARALDRALRGDEGEPAALATYESQRDVLLAPVFDATCALVRYPPVDEFVMHQKRASEAMDHEAEFLAALPALPAARAVAA
ncbi:MAG TPA: NAD(P)/FAD-dependent oxidoreductase [Acidimicrobiia bacterium]